MASKNYLHPHATFRVSYEKLDLHWQNHHVEFSEKSHVYQNA